MTRWPLLILACWTWFVWAQDPAQPEAASGFTPKPAAVGSRYMAATANPHATDAAVAMLKAGGSAVDAAIAAQLVLNVVEPQSSGIGGGGFLLHYERASGRVTAHDGRETAPRAVNPWWFVAADGETLPFRDAVVGGHSVGVPGLLAMLSQAHAAHGRLPWRRLFEPAIRLAEMGFELSPRLHVLLAAERHLPDDPQARALYYDAAGRALPVGTLLRNPRLAEVLREIAEQGPSAFYHGPIAADVAAAVRGHPDHPGRLDEADLAAYRPRVREALCGAYRSYRVCGMPPPSSGGVTVLQILGLLARYERPGADPLDPLAVHRFAEAGRLAYADRGRYLGDPDFVEVPLRQLLDPAYLAGRAQLIDDGLSMGQALPGELAAVQAGDGASLEYPATTHLSIVDTEGNAVALTSSIEDAFGSRLMVRGFLLNNQLTDFAFRPVAAGRPVANRAEGGKRPLSSMAPTLVFDREGRLHAVLGSPGGSRIINYVARALTALLDWRLPPEEVAGLPHAGSRNGPTELERGTPAEALAGRLEALGHAVSVAEMTSGLHLVVREGERWVGAADPRREGTVRGE